jgi:two-component system, cell cycle sensor histidine kinase and response regulator CckA
MTILVVDDESESRTLLTTVLAAEGYRVRPADGGELALASIAVERPELILLDIRMPGMDGFEVCRRLKDSAETRDIPLMFLSASVELNERVQGFKAGAVDFVTKPFQREELLARVRTHLELGRLRADLEKQVMERTSELRESEERFRTMADAAPVMIWTSGPDKRCTFVNNVWLEFTGRSLEEELGTSWEQGVHPDDLERCKATYSSSFDERRGFQMEYRLRRGDGEYRWVLDRGVPRLALGGAFLGYIGSCLDITDLRRAQEEAIDRQKLETVGVLTAGIAHDFNNLLGSIVAETDLALSELPPGEPPTEEIRRIRAKAFRASEIVRELMVYAGHETADFKPVFLSQLVEEMAELLKVSISKRSVLKIDVRRDLPAITGHAAQIRQVMMNLIINASEAIGEKDGVITVTTSHVARDKGPALDGSMELPAGGWARLEVSDTGCGMTEAQRNKIFDPYFTTKFAGRGLGLAVVRGAVRAHGGVIQVVSAANMGTTFQIFLPCALQPAQQPDVRVAAPAGDIAHNGALLFVEDEEMLRTTISRMLRKRGFVVLEADNGSSAIDLLHSYKQDIDVMLLDLTIPGATSRQVLEEVQRVRPHIKIVLTSAYSETRLQSLKLPQVAAFIRKPFPLADLVRLIHEVRDAREPVELPGSQTLTRSHAHGADF